MIAYRAGDVPICLFRVENHEFGWDNEHPQRQVEVNEFRIEWRPVTNGEFYKFCKAGGSDKAAFPKSWCLIDDEVSVRALPVSVIRHAA